MKQKRNWSKFEGQFRFEKEIFELGFQSVAGVDEVGRGCLAGPVVAAAVILPSFDKAFRRVKDSKQLRAREREELSSLIWEKAKAVGVGVVEPFEIDRMNIGRASLKAMRLAVQNLKDRPDFLLVDGIQPISLMAIPQKPIPKGDTLSVSIAAASIVAKVKRDAMMNQYQKLYPQFDFEKHKGYATKKHFEEIEKYGPTQVHRFSFAGVVRGELV